MTQVKDDYLKLVNDCASMAHVEAVLAMAQNSRHLNQQERNAVESAAAKRMASLLKGGES